MAMTPEIAAGLRAPFPSSQVGKLPRITCGKCRSSREKSCDQHQKSKCRQCDNWITSAHMHLDYIGHAGVTDRLLQADPEWTWEPMAFDQAGLPARDSNGGLWIRLTVAGVTRIGYGDAQGKEGPDAVKEAIGDALRNAAMRFGVALDLWSKTPMDDAHTEPAQPAAAAPAPRSATVGHPTGTATEATAAREKLRKACKDNGWDLAKVAGMFEAQHGVTLKEATAAKVIDTFRESLFTMPQAVLMAGAA